jgi:hypothetical protein
VSLLRLVTLVPFLLGLAAIPLVIAGGTARELGIALLVVYGLTLAGAAAVGAFRFRSLRVGALALPALVASHIAYAVGFVRGVLRPR